MKILLGIGITITFWNITFGFHQKNMKFYTKKQVYDFRPKTVVIKADPTM